MTTALSTLEAEALVDELRTLPAWPWADHTLDLQPVTGGLTNRTWLLTVDGRERHFLKVPGAGTESFIDRVTAHAALRAAAEAGVAPRPHYFDPVSGVEVTEFLEGYSSATEGLVSDSASAVEIAQIYRRMHKAPLLGATKTIFDMFDEHLEQLREIDYAFSPWQHRVIERWVPAQAAFVAAGVDIVPCHNDMNVSNYMIKSGAPIRLVDFDYASNNERAYEVGGFAQVYMLGEQTRRDMIEEYFGTVTAEAEARIRIAGLACDMKWGLWGLVTSTLADSDMDYVKFGMAKFVNAENVMGTPQFEEWVAAL